MKTILKISMIATITVLLSSCCGCRQGSPKIGELENTTWQLIELASNATPDSGISIRFDAADKMVYGTAPCNNFFGGFSLLKDKNHNIKIGNVGATRKFCPNTENEDKFAMLIATVTKVEIQGENLLMTDADGTLIAILTAQK